MFLLDFDGTLFDTHLFSEHIHDVFVQVGVPIDMVIQTRRGTTVQEGERLYYGYTFEKHIDALEQKGFTFDKKAVLHALQQLLVAHDYTNSDTIAFLEQIKQYGRPIRLLTAGDKRFQLMKYHATAMPQYFDDVIVVDGAKEEYVASVYDDLQQIFFINDKAPENDTVKKRFPKIEVITKYNPHKIMGNGKDMLDLPTFDSLAQIATYVAKEIR